MTVTVDSKWLASHLDDPDLVIIDGRGMMGYRFGHIKNALPLGIERVITLADNGANLVIDSPAAEKIFGSLGIDDTKKVVVYGEYGDPSAARIVWSLLYHGHNKASLLDAGFNAWQKAGLPVTREAPKQPTPAPFKSRPNPDIRADAEIVKSRSTDPSTVVVDARSAQEHMQARVPNSVLHDWAEGAGRNGQMFGNPEELRKELEENGITPDKEVICYCHSGTRASHKYLQLKLAGYDKVRLYDGSMVDWAQRKNPLR